MKHMIKIVIISLCAALALSSCNKDNHTPDLENQDPKTPICFTPQSQVATVKADLPANNLVNFHQDFGVWAIARQAGNPSPYILWNESSMSLVTAEEDPQASTPTKPVYTGSFIPEDDAFWLNGYTYNFLAVAPYEAVASGVTINQNNDSVAFGCDMISDEGYDFGLDLMAAAAQNTITIGGYNASQALTFRHLLAKINLTVTFTDPSKTFLTGLRLKKVATSTTYTISHNNGLMSVAYTPSTTKREIDLTGKTSLNIIPQNIKDFELYLDFTYNGVSTSNFKVDLSKAIAAGNNDAEGNPGIYNYNEQYNWKITISPKLIAFDVTVTQWDDTTDPFEFPIQ